MDYGEILATAWKITWKNKVLWIFGILIGLTQAVSVGNNIFRIFLQSDILPPSVLGNLINVFNVRAPSFWIGLVLLTCGLMFFMLLLTSIGQIGILKGVILADSSENSTFSFGDIAKAIKTYFWRVFGLSSAVGFGFLFVFMIFYAAIVAAIVGGAFMTRGSGPTAIIPILLLTTICMLPLLCIFILACWIVGAMVMFATIAIINDDLGIVAALGQSFKFLRKHFWKIVLVIFIIGVVAGLIGIILAVPMSFTSFIPLMALGNGGDGRIGGSIVWISVLCLLAYTPILVFLSAILSVYTHAIWTLTYRRLSKPVDMPAPTQPAVEPIQK
jgi:hypothetical protein